jgi:hypothetical protein
MKRWWAPVLAGALGAPPAQANWFTLTGDPRNPAVDTVQINPEATPSPDNRKLMVVRVNRASPRVNWDGMPYRSYEAQVVFDCRARRAWYRSASYYTTPLWAGAPQATAGYANRLRPMLFRDIEPNPTFRIVRAACRGEAGGATD